MSEQKSKKSGHGGKREGAGRPHLDGSPAGQGVKLVKRTVSLPSWMIEELTLLGNGNLSAGIRLLVERRTKKNRTLKLVDKT